MNLEQAQAVIETALNDASLNGFKKSFDNLDLIDVDTGESLIYGDASFVSFDIEFDYADRIEINKGSPTKEIGMLQCNIYVPYGDGARRVYALLDQIDGVILLNTINGVYFRARSYVGKYRVGKWAIYSYQYTFQFCK